jgi:hypothetical protein
VNIERISSKSIQNLIDAYPRIQCSLEKRRYICGGCDNFYHGDRWIEPYISLYEGTNKTFNVAMGRSLNIIVCETCSGGGESMRIRDIPSIDILRSFLVISQ